MSAADKGLAVFVIVHLVNAAGLQFDLLLRVLNLPTVTDLVRASPVKGIPILLWQLAGFVALAFHFYSGLGKEK